MISHLSGTVLMRATKYVVVNVGGVGYKIFTSLEASKEVPAKGGTVELWTHLHVKEDILDLYGFATMAELEFFEMLIGVSGIGPKTALGVLSVAPLDSLKRAIASGETQYLTKISGIGKRIAEKLVVELRDKLAGGVEVGMSSDDTDALDALASLGYTAREAREALREVSGRSSTVDEKIKEALKILGGSRKK